MRLSISGDRIDAGPFSLGFDGEALVSRSWSNNIELVGHGLKRVVKDRTSGKRLTLLAEVPAKLGITACWGEGALEALLPGGDRAVYGGNLVAVLAHLVVFAAATFLLLWLQGRARGKA